MRGLCIFFLLGTAFADEPLPMPTERSVCAAGGKFCVLMTPEAGGLTRAFRYEGAKKTQIWEMRGWFRVAALADDGRHFVTGWDGMNLLPKNADARFVMISFWRDGKPLRDVRLGELIHDLKSLQRTVSHLRWGDYGGIGPDGRYRVTTVEKRTLEFDPATGQELKSNRP
jgi:hypothetical protein